ncbi:MAG: NUDIX domain-containing protein [Desulfosporosinus sp.]|nr:NUDIX domain-containing protein [Desulfosporosinus sp.]
MPKYRWNRYHDLEIDLGRFKIGSETELSKLMHSEMDRWESRIRGKRGEDSAVLWIRIPVEMTQYLGWFLRHVFVMHHATKEYLMVVRSRTSRAVVPLYGTHYTRVECVVIEQETGRVLVVREQIGPDTSLKLVTGSVDLNEYVSKAAIREVKEETEIDCDLVGLLGIGNRLGTRFGRDEVLVGVLLSAKQGQIPRGDGTEICEALWIDPVEALAKSTPMAREWLIVAGQKQFLNCGYIADFRGPPHRMEVYLPQQK